MRETTDPEWQRSGESSVPDSGVVGPRAVDYREQGERERVKVNMNTSAYLQG